MSSGSERHRSRWVLGHAKKMVSFDRQPGAREEFKHLVWQSVAGPDLKSGTWKKVKTSLESQRRKVVKG